MLAMQLTKGQIRYLQMLANGLSQAQIVFITGRNRSTVHRLLVQAHNRLGAETLEQAISITTLLGLIKPIVKRKCPECQVTIAEADAKTCPDCGSILPVTAIIRMPVKKSTYPQRQKD